MYKKSVKFDIDQYVKEYYPDFVNYPDKKLLKVGQKVIVLNSDDEYEKGNDIDFQINRLYVITQFSEGSIWMKYHLEAQSKDEVKEAVSNLKDIILRKYETQLQIPEIIEDNSITDNKARKEEFDNRRYRFDTLDRYRFQRIKEKIGIEKTKEMKKELDKFKAISGSIGIEGKSPLLKMSKENWNFLYEGEDFEISLLGEIAITDI
jgi:CRISPR-associated endonuclease Csn1